MASAKKKSAKWQFESWECYIQKKNFFSYLDVRCHSKALRYLDF